MDAVSPLAQPLVRRPLLAGIIGAGRWWPVRMISVLSIPRRYRDVMARVGMPKLLLDHE